VSPVESEDGQCRDDLRVRLVLDCHCFGRSELRIAHQLTAVAVGDRDAATAARGEVVTYPPEPATDVLGHAAGANLAEAGAGTLPCVRSSAVAGSRTTPSAGAAAQARTARRPTP
jgi:hypothetical protein